MAMLGADVRPVELELELLPVAAEVFRELRGGIPRDARRRGTAVGRREAAFARAAVPAGRPSSVASTPSVPNEVVSAIAVVVLPVDIGPA